MVEVFFQDFTPLVGQKMKNFLNEVVEIFIFISGVFGKTFRLWLTFQNIMPNFIV